MLGSLFDQVTPVLQPYTPLLVPKPGGIFDIFIGAKKMEHYSRDCNIINIVMMDNYPPELTNINRYQPRSQAFLTFIDHHSL